jgi:hypothetical protein
MMRLVRRIYDNRQGDSWAGQLRRRRFRLFQQLMADLPRPLRILDVGGTEQFWQVMQFDDSASQVVLLNINPVTTAGPQFTSVVGDARAMPQFADKSFDVVFSNSVIEHVGTLVDQQRMATEVQRIGKRYFVQTPNRYFPIEPHFLFPFFQFFPMALRVAMIRRFNLGWYKRIPDYAGALTLAQEVRMLSGAEVQRLFPEATIHRERVAGLTKSFVAYGGGKS